MAATRPTPVVPFPVGILIASLGGALGAVGRGALLQEWPVANDAFPWTVFAINVLGSALLAALPLFGIVRRTPWLPLFLGTGVLGGFTTMSTAAVGSYDLRHHAALGLAYLLGTLAAALTVVVLVNRITTPADRALIESEEGDD